MSIISTTLIMKAIQYYSGLGYTLLDVPQCVDFDVSQHTKPEGVPELFHRGMKVYVASAEQSFMQLHKEGILSEGRYMALTPCYRHEACLDDTHYSMFLKLELIAVGITCSRNIAQQAKGFFDLCDILCHVVPTTEGIATFDIVTDKSGVELGSYGVRKMLDGTVYTYGTGIAEPRLSVCMREGY